MNKQDLIKKVCACIADREVEIAGIGEKIYKNPETGFKEYKTTKLVREKITELGLKYEDFRDIPGLKAVFDTGKPGPGIAVMGELDSIVCFQHPDCNPETGAVHACGHCVQVAGMLGAAMGLVNSGAFEHLRGRIYFIAVPAEEYIELEYRQELKDRNIIRYFSGKRELLSRGVFDDIDLCLMIHTSEDSRKLSRFLTCNGHIVKKIRYIGKPAHAGVAPFNGINALSAANLGLSAVNALRETFKCEDYIRVNSIITKGGEISNVIPADVSLECKVRGKTIEAMLDAAWKVERAFLAGGLAMGTRVEIDTMPGYMPLRGDSRLDKLAHKVMKELTDEDDIEVFGHGGGCTDLGDLSTLMPVLSIYVGGVKGKSHSADFRITDNNTAYVLGSQFFACTVIELMWEEDNAAESIIEGYNPVFKNRHEYFKFIDDIYSRRVFDPEKMVRDCMT